LEYEREVEAGFSEVVVLQHSVLSVEVGETALASMRNLALEVLI